MLLPALILPFLAAAAQSPEKKEDPITVTGHVWAPFISPMGEPFRAHTTADDTLAKWFRQADRNHDGIVTPDEMLADAERFFATLDTDHDGEIGPEELVHYEWEVAPEIQVNSRTRRPPGEPNKYSAKSGRWRPGETDEDDLGPRHPGGRRKEKRDGLQGAARYALLNIPEPVAAADTNFDRGVTLAEFREAATARFQLLDSSHLGKLTLAELQGMRTAAAAAAGKRLKEEEALDKRIGNPLPPGD